MMKKGWMLAMACTLVVLGGCLSATPPKTPNQRAVERDAAAAEPTEPVPERPPPAIKL